VECGQTLGTTATGGVTGGAGTRVHSWGCLFSFPLMLARAVNEDVFRATEGGAPTPMPSPDEVFSTRQKPAMKLVDVGCPAVGFWSHTDAAVGLRVSGSWC